MKKTALISLITIGMIGLVASVFLFSGMIPKSAPFNKEDFDLNVKNNFYRINHKEYYQVGDIGGVDIEGFMETYGMQYYSEIVKNEDIINNTEMNYTIDEETNVVTVKAISTYSYEATFSDEIPFSEKTFALFDFDIYKIDSNSYRLQIAMLDAWGTFAPVYYELIVSPTYNSTLDLEYSIITQDIVFENSFGLMENNVVNFNFDVKTTYILIPIVEVEA